MSASMNPSLPLVIPGQTGPLTLQFDQSHQQLSKWEPDQSLQLRFQVQIQMIYKTCESFDLMVVKVQTQQLTLWQRMNEQLGDSPDIIAKLNDPTISYERVTSNVILVAKTPIEILAHAAKTRLEIINQLIDLWGKAEEKLDVIVAKQLENYIKGATAELDLRAKSIDISHQENMNTLKESAESLQQQINQEKHQMDLINQKIANEEKVKMNDHTREIGEREQKLKERKERFESDFKRKELAVKTDLEKHKLQVDKDKTMANIDFELQKLKTQLDHERRMKTKDIIGNTLNSIVGGVTSGFGLFK